MRKCLACWTVAWLIIFCLGTLNLTAAEHHGQVMFGGLPVPGVTVTAIQGDKQLVTVTDAQGLYTFPELQDGVWTLQVEMLCFSPSKQEVTVAAGTPALEWELKLLQFNEINAIKSLPAMPASQPAQPMSPAGVSSRAGDAKKDMPPGKASPSVKADQTAANSQDRFQRTDLNAVNPDNTAANANNGDLSALGGQNQDELEQRAADGLLVSGSVNNPRVPHLRNSPHLAICARDRDRFITEAWA